MLLILTLALQMWCHAQVESVIYPSLQWSPQNPIFKENNTVQFVQPMSKINIVCPNPSTVVAVSQVSTPKDWLYENLWLVSKEAYEACDTTVGQGSRLVLKCMYPLRLAYYTLVFQQYSASVDGLEFQRDTEYYFIATSTGIRSSLDGVSGGNCKKNNMRVRFHICRNSKDHRCNSKPSANQQPSSLFSEAPLPNRTTVRVVTSPLPTRRQPSTHVESTVSSPSTSTVGNSVVVKTVDTSESSIKLRHEEDKPSGDEFSWKVMILLSLLLLSVVVNVILVHWLMRQKQQTFEGQDQQKKFEQEDSQPKLKTLVVQDQHKYHQSESIQGRQPDRDIGQVHAVDVDRTIIDRNLPTLRETQQQRSSSVIVDLQKVLQRCKGKSYSSYNVQTVTL